jgi:hypothetical protein
MNNRTLTTKENLVTNNNVESHSGFDSAPKEWQKEMNENLNHNYNDNMDMSKRQNTNIGG